MSNSELEDGIVAIVVKPIADAEVLAGGLGSDTLNYRNSLAGVTIDLNVDENGLQSAAGGFAEGDVISNFENVLGSGLSDVLTGNEQNNTLKGGAGGDQIFAGFGNDAVTGGLGSDFLAGGFGNDRIIYSGSASGVNVDLRSNSEGLQSAFGGEAEGDTISGFESVKGSAHGDVLRGNNQSNVLIGRDGDDVITGGGGNDLISGGGGADTLSGGNGRDMLKYSQSVSAVTVNLTSDNAGFQSASGGHADGDIISGFDNVKGSRFDDTITGDDGRNSLKGGDGADTISGGGGNDSIRGDAGADILSGGDGFDRLIYQGSTDGVTVDLRVDQNGFQSVSGGDAEGDVVSGFERVTGSDCDDTLIGHAGENVISGRGGDDLIRGSDDEDKLYGGDGFDTVDYSASSFGITVDLRTGADGKQWTDEADVLSGFEAVIGSDHDDVLTVGLEASTLHGGDGSDLFVFASLLNIESVHTIQDFKVTDDTIGLNSLIFSDVFEAVGEGEGGEEGEGEFGEGEFIEGEGVEGEGGADETSLSEDRFVANATGEAETADQRIIYNSTTGVLSYDGDGNGVVEALQIAQLDAGLDLNTGHFTSVAPSERAPVVLADTAVTVQADTITVVPLPIFRLGQSFLNYRMTDEYYAEGYGGNAFVSFPGSLHFNPQNDLDHLRADETEVQFLSYLIEDDNFQTDTGYIEVTIEGVEDRPIGRDDAVSGFEDTPLVIMPLGNDYDPDGGTVLNIISVDRVDEGTLAIAEDKQSITFTPNAEFSGELTINYTIEDDMGMQGSAQIAVTMDAVNDAPVAELISGAATHGATTILTPIFSDIDNDSGAVITVNTIGLSGTAVVQNDGTLLYTAGGMTDLGGGETRIDQFTYTVTDAGGLSSQAVASVLVTGVDDAVTAVDDVATLDEDTPILLTPLSNDSDLDTNDVLFIGEIVSATHGDAVISTDEQGILFTPDQDYNGDAEIVYRVESSGGTTDLATISLTINPVNDAPTTTDITIYVQPRRTNPDGTFTVSTADVPLGLSDVDYTGPSQDGDYTFQLFEPENVDGTGRISYLPDVDEYSFFYEAANADSNSGEEKVEVFTYIATDRDGASVTGTVTAVTMALDLAPYVQADIQYFRDDLYEGGSELLQFYLTDPNPDQTVTMELRGSADSIEVENGTAVIQAGGDTVLFTPGAGWNGVATYEVRAVDETGLQSEWIEVQHKVIPVLEQPDMTFSFEATDNINEFFVTVDAVSTDEGETPVVFDWVSLSIDRTDGSPYRLPSGTVVSVDPNNPDSEDGGGRIDTDSIGSISQTFKVTLPDWASGDYTLSASTGMISGQAAGFRGDAEYEFTHIRTDHSLTSNHSFTDASIWGDDNAQAYDAGFDIGGAFDVDKGFAEDLFQLDARALGIGVTTHVGVSANADVSLEANIRPELSVNGGTVDGDVSFISEVTSITNDITGQLAFDTYASSWRDGSFQADSANTGFDISLEDLSASVEANFRVGGYAHVHWGTGTAGPNIDLNLAVPEVSLDVAGNGTSIVNYDGNALSFLDGLGGSVTGTSLSHTFNSPGLGNELGSVTLTKPVADVSASASTYLYSADGVSRIVTASNTSDFANLQLDLDGIAATLKSITNPVDISEGVDLGVISAGVNLEALDLDVRADFKYQQTNSLIGNDLFGTLLLENGDSFDFKFGDTVHVGQEEDYDLNGDGNVEYSVTTRATAQFTTDADVIVDIYDYLGLLDVNGNVSLNGKIADILGEVGIGSNYSLGTDGPVWDTSGILIDEQFTLDVASQSSEITTSDNFNGGFFA